MCHAGGVLPANLHSPHLDFLKADSLFKQQCTHLTQRLQTNPLRWELFHKATSSPSRRRTHWLQKTHEMPHLISSGSDKRSTWRILPVVGRANAPTTILVTNSTKWSTVISHYSRLRINIRENLTSSAGLSINIRWFNICVTQQWNSMYSLMKLNAMAATMYIAVTYRPQSEWRHSFTRTQDSLFLTFHLPRSALTAALPYKLNGSYPHKKEIRILTGGRNHN